VPGSLPAHVSAIVIKTVPQDADVCYAMNHSSKPYGVMSYYAAQALPTATTLEDWKEKMTAGMKADVAGKSLLASRACSLIAVGAPQQLLPGVAKK
jgi:hypothetical protein